MQSCNHVKCMLPCYLVTRYAWTKAANLFTIEQPKGVGFSYCTGKGQRAD